MNFLGKMRCQYLWIHAMLRQVQKGFETKVQENLASHSLDIDGDFCHHVHNIAKCFTKPFENLLVNLFSNIYTDFNYRSYSREVLASICDVLFFVYTKPPNFVSWRWLSVYDVAISFNYLRIANMVFFTTYFLVRKVR